MEYIIEFYSTEDGKEPAREFIESLDTKMIAKVIRIIDLLERNGPTVRLPYSEYLRNDIFEIRAKQGTDIVRVFYFFTFGRKIVLTNGFVKKTQKTPQREIDKAVKYKNDYIRRHIA